MEIWHTFELGEEHKRAEEAHVLTQQSYGAAGHPCQGLVERSAPQPCDHGREQRLGPHPQSQELGHVGQRGVDPRLDTRQRRRVGRVGEGGYDPSLERMHGWRSYVTRLGGQRWGVAHVDATREAHRPQHREHLQLTIGEQDLLGAAHLLGLEQQRVAEDYQREGHY